MARGRFLTPSTDGGDAVCRSLLIPPELMPFVGYVLDQLRYESNWEEHGDISIADTLAMVETMLDAYPGDCGEPSVINTPLLLPWKTALLSPVSGSELWTNSASVDYGGYWRFNAAEDGDQLYWHVYLAAGDYFFRLETIKGNNAGKLRFHLGLPQIGSTVDLYAATSVFNHIVDSDVFTIDTDGWYQPLLRVDGKNASSTGYRLYFIMFYIMAVAP